MKFKELFNISFDPEVKFDLFQSTFTIPESCVWQSLISLASLDEYLYHNMSDKVLGHRWNSDFIIREFSVDDSIVKKVRQAYFNAIFKAHEYELNGLAESMFFEYDPLVNYDRTETQTHNETVETDDHTTTQNVGARSQTDSGRSDSSSNKTTAFDSGDYTKGTDKNDTTVGGSTLSTAASVDTTTEAGYTDRSNGGYTLRAKGNIGLTTSQQMVESQRQVVMFNFFQKVAEVLEIEMLVNDWETEKEEYVQASSGGGSSVDAYTKAEVNALLNLKADKRNTFTKAEVNDLLDDKADIDDLGTVASINLNGSTTQYLRGDGTFAVPSGGGGEPVDAYTKEETDSLLAEKLGVDEVGTLAYIDLPDDIIYSNPRYFLNAKGNFIPAIIDNGTKISYGALKIGEHLEMPSQGVVDIPFRFGIDGDNNYGYYKADGSFVPFKSGGGEGSAGFLETCELNMPGKDTSSSGYLSIGCIATFSDTPTVLNFRVISGQTYEGQYIKVTGSSIYAKVPGRYLIEYYYYSGSMISNRSIDVKNADDLIYTGSTLGNKGTGIYCAYLGEDIEEPITNILYDGHISNTSRYLTPLTLQKSIFNYSYLLFEVRLNETKFKSCGIPNTAMNAQGQNNIQLGFSADGLTLNTVTYSGAYLDYYLTIRGVK